MFGLSFGKLLVFAAVVAIVWFGWRKLAALGQAVQRSAAGQREPKRPQDDDAIELVRNPETGRYEPRKPRLTRRGRAA